MTRVSSVVVVASILLAAPELYAQGTHFLLEGSAGTAMTDGSDDADWWGIALGYGGKFKGFPLRFYLMGAFDADGFSSTLHGGGSNADRTIDNATLTGGPRIYFPLGRNFRFFVDAMWGAAWTNCDMVVNDLESYTAQDQGYAAKYSAGVQIRLTSWLSLGASVQRVLFWGRDDLAMLPQYASISYDVNSDDQVRFGGSLGVHF